MLLVRTDWDSFEEYVASLSKPARKNYKHVQKLYGRFDYHEDLFDRGEVERYMRLWASQLVRGKPIEWAFGVGHIQDVWEEGNLKVFSCSVGMQFIQRRSGYWECHPPMYDKTLYPELAKYMWFNLIRFAIQNRMEHLNLGGGSDDWRDHIKRRTEFPNPTYKWIYVPEKAKRNPDSEPLYYIESCKLLLRDS